MKKSLRNKKQVRHYIPEYFMNLRHPIQIIVAGVGGTGYIVATNLLRMHITLKALGHIGFQVYLCDHGNVEEPNRGRQGYYGDDVGKRKVHVLSERLNAAAGEYVFFPNPGYICKETFKGYCSGMNRHSEGIHPNIIMGCVDNNDPRNVFQWVMRKWTRQHDKEWKPYYWIDFGNDLNSGQVIMGSKLISQPKITDNYITKSKLPTAIEMMPEAFNRSNKVKDIPSCSIQEAIEKQDLFINPSIADAGCHMLWQMLRNGYTTYNAVYINLETGKTGRNYL